MVKLFPLQFFSFLFIIYSFSGCKTDKDPGQDSVVQNNEYTVLAKSIPQSELIAKIPELEFYHGQVKEALKNKFPILRLAAYEIQDTNQLIAQEIAINNNEFTRDVYDRESGAPLRNEIMNIRKALPGDLPDGFAFNNNSCYRVSMYHYFNNRTTVALVDVRDKKVLFVDRPMGGQPEISKRLTDLAVQIALHSTEVLEALDIKPSEIDVTMPNVKTALNGTTCERSKHLCVAPTFLNKKNDRALWAIVDLTDWKLVGVKWTELGKSGKPTKETERSMQDDYVMENFCLVDNVLEKGNWNINYRLTPSDGLEIFDVSFEGKSIINSAKVVDWHVAYSTKDGFGYSDAMGCPMYSSSAVVAFNGPFTEAITEKDSTIGFALIQDFRSPSWPVPCNYRYQNRFEFYKDGRFRTVCINLGRGCGVDGIYRPIIRFDLESTQGENLYQWSAQEWSLKNEEFWHLQQDDTEYTNEGYLYKIETSPGTGYYIEPGRGQFSDGGRGDQAYTYVSKRKKNQEGDVDLMTIGSCCNTDHRQGPEVFLEPSENIQDEDLIIWYVPQMYNDDRPGKEYCWANTVVENGISVVKSWPGSSGPMFVPYGE